MRNWAFALLTALLVLGAIEAMAWLTHSLLYGEGPGPGPVTGSLPTADQNRGLLLHPFYGVIDDWDYSELNIGSARKECGLVVGLLGGSVASAASRQFELALLRHAASLGSSVSPIVVNLAHHRYRQPRQAQVFVNKLAGSTGSRRFHIVVSLDGFNEVKEPLDVLHISGSGGSLFPKEWPSTIAMTAEQRLAAGRILALRDEQEALLAGLVGRGGIRGSATFGLLRRWRLDRIERLVVRQHQGLFEAGNVPHDLEKHGPRRTSAPDEVHRAAAESWYRGALLLARLAKRHGAEYYHFLQPNQYVPGAKPLTDWELGKSFLPNLRAAEGVRSGYPLLVEYGRRLRERGVEFFDLSRIYADVYETLYTDPCCHLNRRGNELLAAAMLRRIVEATDADDGAIHGDQENESCFPYRAAVAGIEAGEFGEPAARSVFDIYRKERTLVYLKRYCTVDDIVDTFFLHFTRREGGIGGDQFPFLQHGVILDGDICIAIVRLGNGGIVHMRTGQVSGDRDTWSVEPDVAGLETTTA